MNKLNTLVAKFGITTLLVVPIIASAQADLSYLQGSLNSIRSLIETTLIPLVFGLALLMFLWGMFRFFIYGGHDEEERGKGKSLMVWAVIAFVLMVSIWGVVRLISSGLGLTNTAPPSIPNIPESN